MCGIVGYIGNRDAYPIILNGLKRLEYRGYDSAGIALYDGTNIQLCKTKGKVADLEEKFSKQTPTKGKLGIGHTRWATHGVPNDNNSHPHYSNSGDLVIIHNGIIENYAAIKKELGVHAAKQIKKYIDTTNKLLKKYKDDVIKSIARCHKMLEKLENN